MPQKSGVEMEQKSGVEMEPQKNNILVWSDEMKLNCDMECMESYSHPP
jgi:uncharacterized protein YjiK